MYIQYTTVQCNTMKCDTIQYTTIQYNTLQYNTMQYNTKRYNYKLNTPTFLKIRRYKSDIERYKPSKLIKYDASTWIIFSYC